MSASLIMMVQLLVMISECCIYASYLYANWIENCIGLYDIFYQNYMINVLWVVDVGDVTFGICYFEVSGCRPFVFGRDRLGTHTWITVWHSNRFDYLGYSVIRYAWSTTMLSSLHIV